jgi:hypothetical protein
MIAFMSGFGLASVVALVAWLADRRDERIEREATTANLGELLRRPEATSNEAWRTPDGEWWTTDGQARDIRADGLGKDAA